MAYDQTLADRVRGVIGARGSVTEREMFGGVGFMVGGNMACGVIGEDLIVRLGAEEAEMALGEEHTRPFDFTGRPMKGWLFVAAEGAAGDEDLAGWVDAGADHAESLPAK